METRIMFVFIGDAVVSMLLVDCWGIESWAYTNVLRTFSLV